MLRTEGGALASRLALLLVVVSVLWTSPAWAHPGDADVELGGTGSVTFFPANFGYLNAAAVDSKDRIVVAGSAFGSGGDKPGFVERLRADGGRDSVFGPFPEPLVPSGTPNAVVVLDRDDVAVGGVRPEPQAFHGWSLEHLTSTGVGDQGAQASFLMGDFGSPTAGANDIVAQADGDPVAAGSAQLNGSAALAMLRTSAQKYGALDSAFSFDGTLLEEAPGAAATFEEGLACAKPGEPVGVCLPDSKLLVASETEVNAVVWRAVERFNSDGSLDRTFGAGNGVVLLGPLRTDQGTGVFDRGFAGHRLAVDSKGRPVVAMGRDVERLSPDGSPDTSFGEHGDIALESGAEAQAVVIGPQDAVLVAVTSSAGGTVRRYTSAGTPDTAFGVGNGIASTGPTTQPEAIALTHDAKVVIAGEHSAGANGRASVTRLLDVAISPPVLIATPKAVSIQFTLAAPESVGIFVQRRVRGRLVSVGRVPLGRKRPGRHRVIWRFTVNGRRLPSGRYLIRLRLLNAQGRPFEVTKRLPVLVRAAQ